MCVDLIHICRHILRLGIRLLPSRSSSTQLLDQSTLKHANKRAAVKQQVHINAQYHDVKVRGVRQKVEGGQRMHRGANIYVKADPYEGSSPTG